jgi:hypothetical protein
MFWKLAQQTLNGLINVVYVHSIMYYIAVGRNQKWRPSIMQHQLGQDCKQLKIVVCINSTQLKTVTNKHAHIYLGMYNYGKGPTKSLKLGTSVPPNNLLNHQVHS